MPRGVQVGRQWRILRMLQSRSHSIAELANACGVTRRTVYRDLIVLREASFALYRTEAGPVRWSAPSDAQKETA